MVWIVMSLQQNNAIRLCSTFMYQWANKDPLLLRYCGVEDRYFHVAQTQKCLLAVTTVQVTELCVRTQSSWWM